MLKININPIPLIQPFNVSPEVITDIVQTAVETVALELYEEIRQQASTDLKSTRDRYLRNLNQPYFGRLKGTIVLTGTLPNMLEQGASAFDMKQGFAKSLKKKQSKNGGWYLTIPFRWGTGLAENEAFTGALPDEVQNLLKKLKGAKTMIGGQKSSGESLDVKGTPFGSVMTRTAFSNLKSRSTFGSYTHKSSVYQGIQRKESMYENAMQSQYMSFRRVSDQSSKNSWIHPGITQRDFFNKAIQEMDFDTILANTVDEQLEILGI